MRRCTTTWTTRLLGGGLAILCCTALAFGGPPSSNPSAAPRAWSYSDLVPPQPLLDSDTDLPPTVALPRPAVVPHDTQDLQPQPSRTVVPEPASAFLLTIGIALIARRTRNDN